MSVDLRCKYHLTSTNICQGSLSLILFFLFPQLGIRVGNRKKEGDTSETAGCCSLRKKHLKLNKENNNHVVELDFIGKGSIRYYNQMSVEKIVYSNLQRFLMNKSDEGYVFDRLCVKFTIVYSYLQVLSQKSFYNYPHFTVFLNDQVICTGVCFTKMFSNILNLIYC